MAVLHCLSGPCYEAYEVSDVDVVTSSFVALRGVSHAAFSRAICSGYGHVIGRNHHPLTLESATSLPSESSISVELHVDVKFSLNFLF
jgi:hypothetical protein